MTIARTILFGEVVQINEDIKKVVRISEHISLSAQNSIFVARMAGAHSQGFRLISVELRRVSARLQTIMSALRLEIFDLVRLVTYRQKLQLRRRYLATADRCLDGRPYLRRAIGKADEDLSVSLTQIHERMQRVGSQVDRAKRLCKTGGAISRMAKIEAAYGSGFMRQLTQVSEDIEAAIDAIIGILEYLHGQLLRK